MQIFSLSFQSTSSCLQICFTVPTSRMCRSQRWPTCWSRDERTQNPSWVVVYKALITTHHLMCYGNEVAISLCKICNVTFFLFLQRFTQYVASSNSNFQLNGFLDKTGVQGESMLICKKIWGMCTQSRLLTVNLFYLWVGVLGFHIQICVLLYGNPLCGQSKRPIYVRILSR